MTIKRATEEDIEQLFTLFDAVAGEDRWIAAEPGFDKERYERTWRDLIVGKGGVLFVACDDRTIVGALDMRANSHVEYEIGMLVSHQRRRQGVGMALLTQAVGWARENNIATLTLGVFPHNSAALRLYEKMGFVKVRRLERHRKRQSGETWDVIVMERQIRCD